MAASKAFLSSRFCASSSAVRGSSYLPDLGILPQPAQLEVARFSVSRHGSLAARTGKPQRRISLSSINSADVLGSFPATSDKGEDSVPVPIVLIDQDSDANATIVQLSFGDRLGALVDTMKALKHLGLDVTKGTVSTEASVKQTKFFITRLGRKVENPDLLERIRLTVINNLLNAALAVAASFGIPDPMGICLSSPVEGGGAHDVDCQDCAPSSSRSWSRRKSKAGRRARKKKARRDKKRGAGLFDRRGGGGGGGGAAHPAALLARVEAGGSLTEQELQRVPGRVCLSGTSDSACLFTQQGRKGTNQDAMIVWEDFTSRDDTIFCGVFDGHGPYGHMVAKKVRDSLPLKLCTQWKASSNDESSLQHTDMALGSMNSEETASIGKEEWSEPIDAEEDKLPEIYHVLRQSFLKAFKLMDKELKLHPTIDCFCSGTTAVTLVKQGQNLVIGNVGDSRAVMGTRDRDNSLVAVQLTVDLKPNLPREAARIQQCKGRVFALQDEPEVARVWLPNNDSPGLAMARAFGDFCLKDYGLISVPDISYRCLTDRDEFIILATDGVWDVLSNKEAIDVVASAPTRSTAARALVDTAVRSWRLKFPTSKVDDCAVVCLFLDPECSSDFTQDGKSENSCDEAVDTNVVGSIIPQETTEKDLFESVPTTQHGGSALAQPNSPENVEILPAPERKDEKLQGRCQSARSLADCMSATEEEEWSALEGVTRVNSLVNLPRFSSSDKKSTSWKKWL